MIKQPIRSIVQKRFIVILFLIYGLYKILRRFRAYQQSINLDPKVYTKNKVQLMLVELHTQYTPFFSNYHQ